MQPSAPQGASPAAKEDKKSRFRTFVSTLEEALQGTILQSPTRVRGPRVQFDDAPRGSKLRLDSLERIKQSALRRMSTPIRQPINPPPVDELKSAPTAKHPGAKNFATMAKRFMKKRLAD